MHVDLFTICLAQLLTFTNVTKTDSLLYSIMVALAVVAPEVYKWSGMA